MGTSTSQHQPQPLPGPGPAGSTETTTGGERRTEVTAWLLREAARTCDDRERKRLQDEVVVLNMSVATAITALYRGRGIATDDLHQVAYLGLCKAVARFDPSFEHDFLLFAVPTITGEIKKWFRDRGWTVRPPRRIQELQAQTSAAANDLSQVLARSPRPTEIAQFLDIPAEQIIEALAADGCFVPTSLDTRVGEDGNAVLADLVIDDENRDMNVVEARILLAPAVRALSDRDRRILYLRFFQQWTQEQIAQDIGVTQMQVSRLLARILIDLRNRLA